MNQVSRRRMATVSVVAWVSEACLGLFNLPIKESGARHFIVGPLDNAIYRFIVVSRRTSIIFRRRRYFL